MQTSKQPGLLIIPLLLVSLLLSGGAIAASPNPTQHALIVGVSEYPGLDGRDLRAPANDAALVAATLNAWGFENDNISVLADGVEGAELPTHDAIITEMNRLVAEATSPGDFVYVHFSGHGSRQPAASDDPNQEADGFDEIFLPRDIGHWDDGTESVENALVDNEIAGFISGLRDNGVFVWLVFDSCHSGDMTRAMPVDGELDRRIDFMDLVAPEDLDLGRKARERAEASQVRSRGAPSADPALGGDIAADKDDNDNEGGYVAFFAAQTTETTPEFRLPAGKNPRQSHGLFTFTLMNLLQTQPGLTYRQLGEQALHSYEGMHRSRPTPLFIGSAMDAPVFGSSAINRVEQYRLTVNNGDVTVKAGNLHDIGPGTVLAIVPQPSSSDDEVIGYLEISSAEMSSSLASPVAFNGSESIGSDDIPAAAYARPVQRSLDLNLRVALPADAAGATAIETWISEADDEIPTIIQWVAAGDTADVRLTVEDGIAWLAPPSGLLCNANTLARRVSPACRSSADFTPSVELYQQAWSGDLVNSLKSIAKATNLIRLANSGGTGVTADIRLALEVRNGSNPDFNEPSAGQRPQVRSGDRIRFRLENNSDRAQDVTILFVDGRWGIDALYPGRRGEQNRIEAGGSLLIGGSRGFPVTVDTTGLERVVMIAVPGESGAMLADFTFLTQASLVATRDVGSASGGLRGILETAGFDGGTTRGLGQEEQDDTTITVISWETLAH